MTELISRNLCNPSEINLAERDTTIGKKKSKVLKKTLNKDR